MPSTGRFRVLIIEDSPTMRAVCAHSLGTAGIDCAVCGDGETGLALLTEASDSGRPFDGLLLDWLLPNIDGWEVLEKIAADHRLDRLSVMIFTDQPDDRAYRLASQRPNNDIQLKEDLTLLPYRMRKFLTTYSDVGSMGDWRGRQLLKNREQLGGSILFVDDSPTVCAKYGDLLRNNGYRVLIAKSMAEALEVARREKPDLALVDYFMPNGNGDELCRALLADDRTRDVTVVMHSQRKDVIEDALNAGAIDLIWKDDPVNIFLMRTASIMRTLRARRQAKDLDILFAATDALDVGLLSLSDGQWQAFNDTMARFSAECGGAAPFIPDTNGGAHKPAADDQRRPRRIVDHTGRRRAFNIHEVDVADADRVVLVHDVTAMADQAELLEQARDKAVELADAKSRFLANMSHEIRTPLNGVIGMLELLNGSELSEEQRHFTDTGIASAEALLGLIGDVLDFSKIDAGRLELEQAAFKLPEMVEDIGQMLAGKAAEKGLEMICDVEPAVPLQVVGDAGRLRQVLVNLLGNALKFTERGEVGLLLRLEHSDGERATLSFAVTDTGIGIEQEAQQHIFEAFRQADDTTTRRFGGTGLGLAISSQLVELMGGELRLDSRPGEGSSFHFSIDMPLCGPDSLASPWNSEDLAMLAGKRALIVDDSPTNRLYLRHLCRVWEMPTDEAEDGRRGLEVYERAAQAGQPFDLVLLDRMMPEMDGLEFLERLRRRDDLPKAKILLQTSMDEVDEGRNAGKLGAEARLVKPIRRRDLLETLCGLLGSAARRPKRAPTTPNERLDGCRILAVEDNRVNQQVLRGILERAGCNVTLADNGSEALQHLRNDSFDLVLMDCEMPVLDGYSACRKVREIEARSHTAPERRQTILALTAHTAVAERQKCLDAGMDDYLSKPVRAAHLLKTVKEWWQHPARMRTDHAEPAQAPVDERPTTNTPAASTRDNAAPARGDGPEQAAGRPPDGQTDQHRDNATDRATDHKSGEQRPQATDVIDQRRLNSLREALGDIGPVLEAAIAEVPRCLGQLKQAVEMGDASTVGLVSHAMAGFLANLGATEAVARARELEAHGKQTDLTHANELYQDVERSARCAAEALSEILSREPV